MRKIKNLSFIVIFILFLAVPVLNAEEEEQEKPSRHYIVNLSLYYPVSLNRSKHDTANVNLTLLYSRLKKVAGLDLAFGMSAVEEKMEGLQIAGLGAIAGDSGQGLQISGLMSVAGETFQGGQISGLMNVIGESGEGLQVSGLFNVSGTRLRGWQTSTLFNVVGEDLEGVQLSGGFNVAGTRCAGVQAGGLFNVTGEDFQGVQAAGLFNVVGRTFDGLQMGTFNVAVDNRGAQLGVANISETMRGFQLGLVNWNDRTEGLPIGLVNVSKQDGFIKYIGWAGSSPAAVNSGIKFEVGRSYSIVSLGYWNFHQDAGSALSYSGFYGFKAYRGAVSVGLDLGYSYLDNGTLFRSRIEDPDHHVITLRTLLSRKISSRAALIGGAGLAYFAERHCSFGDGEFKPLLFFGLELE